MTEFPLNPTPAVQSDAPAVVRYMQENKLLLEARDADQMQLMVQRWLHMEDQLGARISDLTQHLAELKAAGEPITQEMLMARERYQRLLWQIQQELEDYTEFAADLIAKSQKELGRMGIEHGAQAIQLALGEGAPGIVGAYFDKLPISAVENMVGLTATGSPVADVLAKHWPDAVQRMTDILVRNTGLGINPRQTAREMADGMAAEGLNNAMTVARTEQLRVYREASRQQYQKSGLVPQYRRMCARQPRTCMACIALDGEVYDTEDLMELHPNDRCTMIPLVAGMPPIEMETGKEWFEKQPEHVQRKMMGPGRYDLYEKGQIDLEDLVVIGEHPDWGPTAGVRSLADLRETAPASTAILSRLDPDDLDLAELMRTSDFDYITHLEVVGKGGINESFVVDLGHGEEAILKYGDVWDAEMDAEVLIFEMSEELGFDDLVPTTVIRESDTYLAPPTGGGPDRAVMQHWVQDSREAFEVPRLVGVDERSYSQMVLMDSLSNNTDRHTANWLVRSGGEVSAIDNGLSFRDMSGGFFHHSTFMSGVDTWSECKEQGRILKFAAGDIDSIGKLLSNTTFKQNFVNAMDQATWDAFEYQAQVIVKNKSALVKGVDIDFMMEDL